MIEQNRAGLRVYPSTRPAVELQRKLLEGIDINVDPLLDEAELGLEFERLGMGEAGSIPESSFFDVDIST